MKALGYIVLILCLINIEAPAVVLMIAQADDPKKAEEILLAKDKANKEFIVKSRSKLKERHAVRKLKMGTGVATNDEDSENKSKPLPRDGDSRNEIKEVDRPQQSSQ